VTTVAALLTGHLFDGVQLDLARLPIGGVMNSLTFAVLCFVGFESAATLAGETRRPARNVPIAVTASTLLAGLFFVAMAYFMVLDFGNDTRAIAASASPLSEVARRAGHAALAGVLYFGALISASACVLATLVAVSRLLFSMARYGAMPAALAAVDPRRRIPHVALGLSAGLVLAASLAVLPLGVFDAFGDVAALASLAFVVLYLIICVAAPIDLKAAGSLRLRHLLASAGGILVMGFVAFGSLWPVPPWPQNLLPWLFAAYLLAGTVWFRRELRRRPALGRQLQLDLES
jgi:amino acid transporter